MKFSACSLSAFSPHKPVDFRVEDVDQEQLRSFGGNGAALQRTFVGSAEQQRGSILCCRRFQELRDKYHIDSGTVADPGNLDAVLGNPGVGEDDRHISFAQQRRLGQLHVGVGVVDDVGQDLDQLIPKFSGAGAGTAETEQIDRPGGQDRIDDSGDSFEVQRLIRLFQCRTIGVQDIFCSVPAIVRIDNVDGLLFFAASGEAALSAREA